MKSFKSLLLLFINLVLSSFLFAQQSFDSAFTQAASVYNNTMRENIHLYNGIEYIDYDHRITGDPFFEDSYLTKGSIIYDGIFYDNLQLFYDVLRDNVVIKNYNNAPLLLINEKVAAFSLLGHKFINIETDSTISQNNALGFCDVLSEGYLKLLAKRKKVVVEKSSVQYSESVYTEKDAYYILKDEILYPVSDEKTVLALMKDKKSEVQKFLHQNKIKFRKNPEAAMIKMVDYYNQLNKDK
jgi:hypothetical protein